MNTKNTNRSADGRYNVSNEKICKCGHTLGSHIAGGHECIVHEVTKGAPVCECEAFRRDRKAVAK